MIEDSQSGVSVFISYVRDEEDLKLKKELDKYLKVLKRSSKVQRWNDKELLAGKEREQTIMAELNKANIILLLISVDFIDSDFIWDNVLTSAMQRHEEGAAFVVPILLRQCDWSGQPYAKLQALPRSGTPIADYPNHDDAFTEIAKDINDLVDHILARAPAAPIQTNRSQAAPVTGPLKESLIETPVMSHKELRQRLTKRLSPNDVKQVAFDLNIDYENLEGDDTKTSKIMALISYVERKNMKPDFIQLLAAEHPHVFAQPSG